MIGRSKIALAGAAAIVLSLVPIPYLACPDWSIQVVDEQGRPLQGMLVHLDYQNYSVEDNEHEEDQYSDKLGRAAFHHKTGSASILRRCFYTARSALEGVHASFGTHAWVNVFGQGREGEATQGNKVTDWQGSPSRMESLIVAGSRPDLPPAR